MDHFIPLETVDDMEKMPSVLENVLSFTTILLELVDVLRSVVVELEDNLRFVAFELVEDLRDGTEGGPSRSGNASKAFIASKHE